MLKRPAILERLVVRQLMDYLPANQSGCRPGHSTENVVLRVLSDIFLPVDREDVATLILSDFFSCIRHG